MINYCINILYKHKKYTSCTIQVTEIFLLDYGAPRINLTGLLIPFIKLNFLHPLKTSQTQNQQTVSMTVLCLQICREDYKPSKFCRYHASSFLKCWFLLMLYSKMSVSNFTYQNYACCNMHSEFWTWKFTSDMFNQ